MPVTIGGAVSPENSSGFKPFMEYAGSYALFNYRLEDPALGMEYSNLRLIRAFEHGLDQSSSEAGFVLVHVDMVQNSGLLVEKAVNALSACGDGDRKAFNDGLEGLVEAMVNVNGVMDGEQIFIKHFSSWAETSEIDIIRELCGRKANRTITTASVHSFSESPNSRCFHMGLCMKA